jgi:dihydroxy-acid dehydratase
MRILHASGGSSNAIIHLLALSGRILGEFQLEDINSLAKGISVLADVQPSGTGFIQDFEEAGGVPALISQLREVFELDALTCFGSKWSENLREINPENQTIRPMNNPVHPSAAFSVVKGSLAPNGALIKISAASEILLKHRGPAIVFDNYEEMLEKIDDPEMKINKDHVLILRGCGPVGVPGMPEWGMIPIPRYLLGEGVEDMVRISDARMSGTSFGTCILHVSPESAIGGPLSLVRNGDTIELDVFSGILNLLVPEEELEARAKVVPDFNSNHLRGWPYL